MPSASLPAAVGAVERVLGGLVELGQMGFMPIHLGLGSLHLGVHRGDMLVHIILGGAATETDGQGCDRKSGASSIEH